MRKLLWPGMATVVALTIAAGLALGGNGETNNKNFEYAIGLWGDLPYNDVQATTGVPNLIADMNNSDLEFTVHDGDLKAGSGIAGSSTPTVCNAAMYQQGLDYLNALRQPAMFTPGDNDWTDCDRPANGGYNSRERLDYERGLFFATQFSLGQHVLKQEVQSTPPCLGFNGPTQCVENRRWTTKHVTYATVNVQGSCNNLCDTAPDSPEYAARNVADIAWLAQTFDEAKAEDSAAVMIIGQADPGFDASDVTRAPLRNPRTLVETDAQPDGFHDFLVALRDQTISFGKPVVYVHGDSHYFRVDKPLLDAQGRRLENFTRVETFGDNAANDNNDVHWVKALVDPNSRDVFAFQAQIVPANRTAVVEAAGSRRPTLEARAVLSAETFAPGPPSGGAIGGPVINGISVPFASQPVQGFSAILPAGKGSYWVMEDNGYGAKANSADFLLRVYHMTPHFETARGGAGTVDVGDFVQLRDPDGKVPFALTRGDRLLTGADFDIESVRRAKDDTLWFGDEFGPFLLHTDATGKVLEAPIPLPGVQAPENAFLVGAPNLASSGGFEGMAIAPNGTTLYPMLEKAVSGDDVQVRRINEFDVAGRQYTGRIWKYRLDAGSVSIGDFTQLDANRFVVIERDGGQGLTALNKRIYEVDLRRTAADGTLTKTLVVDLMNIFDPYGISLPGRSGDIGLGTTFTFPYTTIEDVLPLDGDRLLVVNDNNFPFSTGRNAVLPDYNDFIIVRTDALKNP
jgi:hypothetical protein